MKSAFLALALLLVSPPALPRTADPPPPPHGPPGPEVTVLHLRETAEKSVVPDQLRVAMRSEESGTDPRNVQSAINRHMAAALGKARQVASVTAETGSYTLFQERPPHAPARWHGSQSLILVGKDAQRLLQLTGELQSDGLVMSSLAYETSPKMLRGAEEALTAEALKALARRAAMIADRLHLAVLGYRDLTVGNAETGPPPMLQLQEPMVARAMTAPVAAPGRTKIRLTVTAELMLGPPRP